MRALSVFYNCRILQSLTVIFIIVTTWQIYKLFNLFTNIYRFLFNPLNKIHHKYVNRLNNLVIFLPTPMLELLLYGVQQSSPLFSFPSIMKHFLLKRKLLYISFLLRRKDASFSNGELEFCGFTFFQN